MQLVLSQLIMSQLIMKEQKMRYLKPTIKIAVVGESMMNTYSTGDAPDYSGQLDAKGNNGFFDAGNAQEASSPSNQTIVWE